MNPPALYSYFALHTLNWANIVWLWLELLKSTGCDIHSAIIGRR
jgi:hypothetical protein